MKEDCIFCKFVTGEIPVHVIYEDDHVLAFLDNAGDFEGHTLVIPKKHYKNLFDCPAEELGHIMQAVQKIGTHFVKNCGFEGFNVLQNNEHCAEQAIFHLHFHIVPRQDEGHHYSIYAARPKQEMDFNEIWKRLRLPQG